VSPPVRAAAAGWLVPLGPPIDDAASWEAYRRDHSDRRYAVAKRALSRREFRRHGLSNRLANAR
jgi:hypothetical protein